MGEPESPGPLPMDPFPVSAPLRQRLDLLGQEFLAEFLGLEVDRRPDNVDALAELGNVLTRLGRLEEGLDVDQRLARLAPDNPTVHYNLGCSLALLARNDEALGALEHAVELGYDDAQLLADDEDLENLRGDPRFLALLRKLRDNSGV